MFVLITTQSYTPLNPTNPSSDNRQLNYKFRSFIFPCLDLYFASMG